MKRQEEIRTLLSLSPDEVKSRAGKHLIVYSDLDSLHEHMAQAIATEIAAHQSDDSSPLRLILPVGPTGQYPILIKLITEQGLSLKNCWFFFMDEYADYEGKALDASHPLSFKGIMNQIFFQHLPETCGLIREQMIFPDEHNIERLPHLIDELDGIHTCYGGIGIHGHLAFNEPHPNVSQLSARKVHLNDFTITINAIRSQVGGNLENFPTYAYTLGMKEILSAQKIYLYCRNGIELDWANTILRLALFGESGDDYPVTHIRNHNYVIITDEATLASPKHII